jgi:hypothetical protein
MINNYSEAQADALGDGFSNEYQRCYAESQLRRPLHNQRAVAKFLHAIGRVVVCGEWEACYPVTDGLLGYDWVVLAHFATRQQAREAFELNGPEVFIYEPETRPWSLAPVTTPEDDIPF